MSLFDHNVFENVRTRVLVIHDDKLLLLEPEGAAAGWRLPGGGLEINESLAECGEREVDEETGLQVRVTRAAFLREFVIPKYCQVPESEGSGVTFTLEVYFYADLLSKDITPRRENEQRPQPHWIPLDEVPQLPLWPKELKTLAAWLAAGNPPLGVPSFVSQLESPYTPAPQVDFH